MPNTAKGTPYVQSSDLVSAYPTVSLSLANHIDNNVSYNAVTYNSQTGTSYTFVLADASTGRITTASNAAAQTYTVPPQTSVAWASGALIRLVNLGAGAVTVVGGAGVTVSNAAGSIAQWESINLLRTGSDTWAVVRGGLPKASYSSTTGSPTVTTVSGKTCVQFTGSGSITISQAGTVELLVVGAGGGGGEGRAGGGGAGGFLAVSTGYLTATTHTIWVGGGGAGGTGALSAPGNNGEASRVGPYYGVGGGGGGAANSVGLNGGSGGGSTATAKAAGAAASGQGNVGGLGTSDLSGGGGGGAGAVGQATASSSVGGNGGNGTASSITGSSVTYAGGGGGGTNGTGGTGGTGGGGAGSGTAAAGTGGSVNTGGGGGGGGTSGADGGNGGSGVVILLFG